MIYLCCNKRRRLLLRQENERRKADGDPILNGADFLEVLDQDAPSGIGNIERQNTLLVRMFEPGFTLDGSNVIITGGQRITPVRVLWAHTADAIPAAVAPPPERALFAALPEPDRTLVVRTDSTGDYSTYRLSLVQSAINPVPPDGFDPLFSSIDFSFKVECPSDFDCADRRECPPVAEPLPLIDYLAKDYASFRRQMLDRMSLLVPGWTDRTPADLGITLVELMAYVGDRLSYQQDATATEAYLDTTRKRVSVRRHARLVDYFMHDGCNARTWVQIQCQPGTSGAVLPSATQLATKVFPDTPVIAPDSRPHEDLLIQRPVVFETMTPLELFSEHERMTFYTWGDAQCCLPKGATRATLLGHFPNLKTGDVVMLAEVLNPRTGTAADADRTRRHPVRLTQVQSDGTGGGPLVDPLNGEEITEITWASADALPVPFCLSAVTDTDHDSTEVSDVSELRGNLVLADHGRSFVDQPLGTVPDSLLFRRMSDGDSCSPARPQMIPPRFRPQLGEAPVTQAGSFDRMHPVSNALVQDPAEALPAVQLESTDLVGDAAPWNPQRDLLNSDGAANEFVLEVESDGSASVRFGDDAHGRRPESGSTFAATRYRIGNGTAGNIGAESLFHIVTNEPAVAGVRNPMPAKGGTEPETMEEVRQRAPHAFRNQERAVTEADYADKAQLNPGVQRAAATFRWTGSWHTVFLTVDPLGGVITNKALKQQFRTGVLGGLERYRMAGHDLEADEPRYVPLEIVMHVCVKAGYFRSDMRGALLSVFHSRLMSNGRKGVFHADNFTFGQAVYLSPLYAAAQEIAGVGSVHITTFQRQDQPGTLALETGRLELDRLEIARCDNDPGFPEHGIFQLDLGGGK